MDEHIHMHTLNHPFSHLPPLLNRIICNNTHTHTHTHSDNVALFSDLISRTAQDIETLIDSLPSQEYTPEKQVDGLKKLEMENSQSAERLARAVKEGGTVCVCVCAITLYSDIIATMYI